MEQQTTSENPTPGLAPEAQKYVLFGLTGETYGLSLLQLQEILATCEYTITPNLPNDFHGVVGIRREIIPVLNLRRRFGYPEAERTKSSRVIVVDLDPNPLGVQVDEVFRVTTIRDDEIEKPPDLTCGQKIPYVTGVSQRDNGKLIIHLDMQKVLSSLEQIQMVEVTDTIRDAYTSTEEESEDTTDSATTPEGETEEGNNRSEPQQSARKPEEADVVSEMDDGQTPQKRRRKRRERKKKSKSEDIESEEPGMRFVDFVLPGGGSAVQDATPTTASESNGSQASDQEPGEQEPGEQEPDEQEHGD